MGLIRNRHHHPNDDPPLSGGGSSASQTSGDESQGPVEWADWTREEAATRPERALLAGVVRRGRETDTEQPLEELGRLAEAAGAEVLDRVVQNRDKVNVRTYLGRGKVDEIAALVRKRKATVVLIDDDLTPAQERNLTDVLGVRAVDRSELILDIFAQRARTGVAKAQVELAQLEYFLPRLPHLWRHLSRLGGGIGTRGPGETQLEVDRRRVRDRITRLRRHLEKVNQDFEVQRKAARGLYHVALVGYTNSGKSTMLNALTGAEVAIGDRLFETLDTTTRQWDVQSGTRFLVSDTVGFIQRLPHRLIASFHATLGEVRVADLLLHVIDLTHAQREAHITVVEDVLDEIGVADKPAILVFNKMDCMQDDLLLHQVSLQHPDAVIVSARTGEGLDRLAAVVMAEWEKLEVHARVRLPLAASRGLAFLHAHGRVEACESDQDCHTVTVRIPPRWLNKLAVETEGLQWEAQ